MRIGLLGGTFDPPHCGHLEMAKIALISGKVDVVWFLPCWKHAFEKEPSDFYHRLTMCYLMIKDEPNMFICADEAEIQSSYSIDIINLIKEKNPDKEFRLIIGTDNYWKMDQWKDKDLVLELAKPIWISRPNIPEIPEEHLPCSVNVSSTEIKKIIYEVGGPYLIEELNPLVRKYIDDHRLYGVNNAIHSNYL